MGIRQLLKEKTKNLEMGKLSQAEMKRPTVVQSLKDVIISTFKLGGEKTDGNLTVSSFQMNKQDSVSVMSIDKAQPSS